VALKLLPDYFTTDEQRVKRFKQEAQAASALNHPNIITIHDIGESDGRHFIAMEYIDGETLGEKIHRNKAPLYELLKYLQQVAEGLNKANAAGIVHRDLKPDNIMITRDGYAKVLDFGLAKLVEQPRATGAGDADSSEVETALMRQQSLPGMVMGTVGYMSPEQAMGRVKDIDHRSDIFSFGCILYEAATGRRAFEGKDALDSLHKIVHAETPKIKEANPHAPDDLERIARRCLAKDPEKRYQSIKDVAIELEDIQQELRHSAPIASAVGGPSTTAVTSTDEMTARQTSSAEYLVGQIKRHKTGAALIAAALVIALAGLGFLLFRSKLSNTTGNQPGTNTPVHFQTMKLTRLTTSGKATDATISPDGKYVAYLNIESRGGLARDGGTASIWIRQVATSRNIMIVEPGQFISRGLTFSPDGNYLYYRAQQPTGPNKLFRIPVLGGDAQPVIVNVFSPISFSPDGKRLAFVRNHSPVVGDSNVLVANADGTDERIIATRNMGELFASPGRPSAPVWSPDGKVLACALGTFNGSFSLVEVQVEDGAEREIGAQRWASIDKISWLSDGSALMLTARDQSSPQAQVWHVAYPSGEAQRVTNDLNDYQGIGLTADSNTMVVVQTARQTNIWLASSSKPTEARQVTSGVAKADGYWGISWTPDGKLVYGSNASGNRDIWQMDISRGAQRQLTSDVGQNFYPVVAPDGRYIIFASERGEAFGLWRMNIDGSNPRQLIAAPILGQVTCSLDGKWIIYTSVGSKGIPALWKIGVDGGEPIRLSDQYWEELPSISPDGKQIAFQYFLLGAGHITIGQIPLEGGEITKIAEPPFRLSPILRWAPDGSSIAYIDNRGSAGNLFALPVGGGAPKQLTDFKTDAIFWFDWSPDGKQLALSRGTQVSDVVLISNFR
jgi:serine/threonine protein kinase/dipeptidyl aminopeptidase/acylaminoacyl peptidase